MKISFIILHYNQSCSIEETLYSVVYSMLKYNNLEIIVLDDFSDVDEYFKLIYVTENIKRKFNINIFVFRTTSNTKNQSKLRNIGIKISSGNYIAFLDGDDYINPLSLYEIYQLLNRSKCDVCFPSRILGWSMNGHKSYNKLVVNPYSLETYACGISNYIIKKNTIIKFKILFDEDTYNFYAEDLYFFCLLMYVIKKYKITFCSYDNDWYYCGLKRKSSTFVNNNAKNLNKLYWINYHKFILSKFDDSVILQYSFNTSVKFLKDMLYNKRM